MSKSNIKNTNLRVAEFSLECVKDVLGKSKDLDQKYKTLVKKMGTMIQKNGLINTLVFNFSKSHKDKEHDIVLRQIMDWNKKNIKTSKYISKYSMPGYIEDLVNLNPSQYRLITKEMITLFSWISRMAQGMIVDENEGED